MQINAPKALELQVILVNTINLHRLELGIGGDHSSLFYPDVYLVENRLSHLSNLQSLGTMVIVYNFHMIL